MREKGCFSLYKAASCVSQSTIVWTSVFSWRSSDAHNSDVLGASRRGLWEASLARGKKPKPRCLGDVESSAFRNIFLSRFSFCSLVKTNIHQKGGRKGGVLRENDFLWQEYYLIFWPLKVFLVRTQIPCVIVQLTYYYIDTLFILYQIDFKSTALKINWWLFFFIKFCVWHLHSFQNVSVHQKCHYSECLFSAALVWLPFNIVHTLYLCFTVMSNKNVDFIFCTKCPMYRIKKKFIETAKIGKWHNYFSLENICNFML